VSIIHSFSSLSYDRSKGFSKASSPHIGHKMLETWKAFNLRIFSSLHGLYQKSQFINDITWRFSVNIFTQIGKDYRKYGYKLIRFLKPIKTVTKPIFAKISLTGQFFRVTPVLNFTKMLQTL
jgi:hypothetical protein